MTMTTKTLIKLDVLFIALGYSSKTWKGQKTTQLQKQLGMTKEDSQKANVLTLAEVTTLLTKISESKSKYKATAKELLAKIEEETLDTSFVGEDGYTPEVDNKPKKSKVFKYLKADLETFIRDKGLWEEFQASKGYEVE